MNENIKFTISVSSDGSLEKGRSYWYQKNKTDIPEYINIVEVHKDDNDCYYTIVMRDKTEKQTIGKYLFSLKKPPSYQLLPSENRDRHNRIHDYCHIRREFEEFFKDEDDIKQDLIIIQHLKQFYINEKGADKEVLQSEKKNVIVTELNKLLVNKYIRVGGTDVNIITSQEPYVIKNATLMLQFA